MADISVAIERRRARHHPRSVAANARAAAAATAAASAATHAAQGAKEGTPIDSLLLEGLRSQAGNFQSSLQRILESVKFELDVRGSIAQKHMEAVREEMTGGMQEVERRCLDISKQADGAVGVRRETERQMQTVLAQSSERLQRLAAAPRGHQRKRGRAQLHPGQRFRWRRASMVHRVSLGLLEHVGHR